MKFIISRTRKITMKIKNRILAIPADVAAIPPKPNIAATNAITRNTTAHPKSPIV